MDTDMTSQVQDLARQVGKILFDNGIYLSGCGCCGAFEYQGVAFDNFTVDHSGLVTGSALIVPVPPEVVCTRVSFKFSINNRT